MKRKAFTLIELLVVIAILALLMGVLMPSLVKVRQQSKSVVCLSNLRQMAIAAGSYAMNYDDHYPIANYTHSSAGMTVFYQWDFILKKDWNTTPPTVQVDPGILWQAEETKEVQQCPSYKGANWLSDPYSGYNYNTSYIGSDQTKTPPQSEKTTRVRTPHWTALFGDGEYSGGANKYMRAPFSNPKDAGFSGRYAGTQGYRHLNKTNVAFCDGHAEKWEELHTNSYTNDTLNIENHNSTAEVKVGFLSEDNKVYDLR